MTLSLESSDSSVNTGKADLVIVQAWKPTTQEAEAGGWEIQGEPELLSETLYLN